MAQTQVTNEYLLQLQEQQAKEYGMKVDVYHSEIGKTIGVFPHNAMPIPPNALRVIRY
ncbi:hypothetical protein [Paenibacillus sp. Mc5Re-14]|uniref:hypothetical protein n=1 Tax=Paenibacillus sp. Mc5Re-14 TaxID=1030529 RepID=UPI000AFE3DA1|nr:hypothetical protein [Paenibacillus sp. Mc5Re-14]